MAKSRSQKSIYESNYGGGYVTPQQYLVECLCVLIARNTRIELRTKFWKEEYWTKTWARQSKQVQPLLAKYPHAIILEAMRDRRCWKITSFGAKSVIEPIIKEKLKLAAAKKALPKQVDLPRIDTTQQPQTPMVKQSIISKLKGIDG